MSETGPRRDRIVISLHGIKTRGTWQKRLASELSRAGFIPESLDYGNFLALQLLWPPARRKKVDWFRDEYTEICDRHGGVRPSVIAHSFGSYIVARAIELYQLRFDRIIFCGAIVRRDYPWTEIRDADRVEWVLNQYGGLDIWARVVEYVVKDAGQSGLRGFEDQGKGHLIQQGRPEFRHSDYFYPLNYRQNWIPFLYGTAPEPIALPDPRPNRRFRFVAALVLAFLLGVLLWWFFWPDGHDAPTWSPVQSSEALPEIRLSPIASSRRDSIQESCGGDRPVYEYVAFLSSPIPRRRLPGAIAISDEYRETLRADGRAVGLAYCLLEDGRDGPGPGPPRVLDDIKVAEPYPIHAEDVAGGDRDYVRLLALLFPCDQETYRSIKGMEHQFDKMVAISSGSRDR